MDASKEIENTLTNSRYIDFSNLFYEIRKRPFNSLFRGHCKTALEMLTFIHMNHLEKEYNRISNILFEHGFAWAVLSIYTTYLCYFDLYEEEKA